MIIKVIRFSKNIEETRTGDVGKKKVYNMEGDFIFNLIEINTTTTKIIFYVNCYSKTCKMLSSYIYWARWAISWGKENTHKNFN